MIMESLLGNLSTRYAFSSTLYDRVGDTYVLHALELQQRGPHNHICSERQYDRMGGFWSLAQWWDDKL